MSSKVVITRSEQKNDDTWDLSPLFTTDEEWEQAFSAVEGRAEDVLKFSGTFAEGPEKVADAIHWLDDFEREFAKVGTYAHLKHDEDLADPTYQRFNDRVGNLGARFGMMSAFMMPEITSLPLETLEEYAAHESLLFAKMYMAEMIRLRSRVLSEPEEKLMAMASEALASSAKTFGLLNDTDMSFPNINDHDGEEVELSHSRFVPLQMGPKREVREDVFGKYYETYKQFANTYASTVTGNAKTNIFEARARKYSSAREAALDGDRVPVAVYDNLINAIHENMPLMHRYVGIRKKTLGVDELHFWDVYAHLVPDHEWDIEYSEAMQMVLDALGPLGDEYLEPMKKGLESRWIDVYENKGKRSGAYSSGCYDSPPYILLNYHPNIDWVFTLAHELGHSMHSYFSRKNQPHIDAGYSIFVAEVASTVNEALMNKYLLDRTTDPKARKYLVNHYLESFKGTLFRQTMFAQFERDMYAKLENDEPLAAEDLSKMYGDLNTAYFGPEMVVDEGISLEWARIPHFYYDFYVYKYATSMCASLAIAAAIMEGKEGALDKYMAFLKAGGSDYPMEVLKRAGVDLSTPEPIHAAMKVFEGLLDQMEDLMVE